LKRKENSKVKAFQEPLAARNTSLIKTYGETYQSKEYLAKNYAERGNIALGE
jgi:hypothetical protein